MRKLTIEDMLLFVLEEPQTKHNRRLKEAVEEYLNAREVHNIMFSACMHIHPYYYAIDKYRDKLIAALDET